MPENNGKGTGTAARRIAIIANHLSTPRDPLLENASRGFELMKSDGRISDIGPSPRIEPKQERDVGLSQVRFSQYSLGSGFKEPASPGKGQPPPSMAVALRGANPLSVLTEQPAKPSALMVRNEDDGSFTTFDHRRLVNAALHAPGMTFTGRVTDKAEIPFREFGKYTTDTRGDSIHILSPTSPSLRDDPRRDLGTLSATRGPDAKLKKNVQGALTHMINREAVLAELTGRAASQTNDEGSNRDFARHTERGQEYKDRLASFERHFVASKPKL